MYICIEFFGFVAQLDRASDYGSEGLGFESLQDHLYNLKCLSIKASRRYTEYVYLFLYL